jgi:hypothetical protein
MPGGVHSEDAIASRPSQGAPAPALLTEARPTSNAKVAAVLVGLAALAIAVFVIVNLGSKGPDISWSGSGANLKEDSPSAQLKVGTYVVVFNVSGPCYESAVWGPFPGGTLFSLEQVDVHGPGSAQLTAHAYNNGPYYIEVTDVDAANGPASGCPWTATVHRQ